MAARMTIVTRLSEALARNGRFAVADRVLDVGIALERMYVPSEGKISWNLRNRAAGYLATDKPSQESIRASMQEFYNVKSYIVHNRLEKLTPKRVQAAFHDGFDIARRSLFRMLREGRGPRIGTRQRMKCKMGVRRRCLEA